jgi:hypothetical protein
VDHELQRKDPTGNLRNLIQGLIDKAPVDLIAEEAEQNDATIAQEIARDRSIRWSSVDATLEDKIQLGIYDELMNRPRHLIFKGDMCVGEKGRYLSHADTMREELWVFRTLANEVDAAMIVCGLLHMQYLADRLTARGCVVFQINVCETDWYKEHYGEVKLYEDSVGNLWYESRFKTPRPVYGRSYSCGLPNAGCASL